VNFLKIKAGGIPHILAVPGSKSYINRALICGALKEEKIIIENINYCDDVVFLVKALQKIGLEISQEESKIEILNSFPTCERDGLSLDIGSGGTTLRFLLPLLSLGTKEYKVILSEELSKRPHDDLIQSLRSLGARIEKKENSFIVQGPISKKEVVVDAALSSQFASALTLLKVWDKDFKIEIKNLKTSPSYLKMTEYLVTHFQNHNFFTVPGDFSSAAFPIVFSCVTNTPLILSELKVDPLQADTKILNVLKKVGGNFQEKENVITMIPRTKTSLKSFEQDISDCLDLAPALAFLASFCEGRSALLNISALKYKESDRLSEIQKLLDHFGIEHEVEAKTLWIQGKKEFHYRDKIQTAPDHRMVMTASLFLRALNGGIVSWPLAVNKSYPSFFKDLFGDH